MSTATGIKAALARSVSHTEIVWIEVDSPKKALEFLYDNENATELEWTECELNGEKIIDISGLWMLGKFRLHIAKA